MHCLHVYAEPSCSLENLITITGMLFRVASLSSKTSLLRSFLCKKSNAQFVQSKRFDHVSHKFSPVTILFNAKRQFKNPISVEGKASYYSTTSAEALAQDSTDSGSRLSRKKARRETPEMILRIKLDRCSKNGDLAEALRLYNEARVNKVELNVHHYNVLLYLCSSSRDCSEEDVAGRIKLDKGFEIFKQMGIDKVEPNEATFTNISRLAAAKENPELAFDLVKQMVDHGIVPKLRSYGPALFGFCKKGMADAAYEVDSHMSKNGMSAEETELSTLLRVSSEVKRDEKVYEMIHRLRTTVRQVTEETAATVEDWFKSSRASEVGAGEWDVDKVKKGFLEGGGGWHGQGWLGNGNWRVVRTRMDETGVCQSCREKLVCIDIDPQETENFAKSLAALACQKESRANFAKFQVLGWFLTPAVMIFCKSASEYTLFLAESFVIYIWLVLA